MFVVRTIGVRPDGRHYQFRFDKLQICPTCNQSGDHEVTYEEVNRDFNTLNVVQECSSCHSFFFNVYVISIPMRNATGFTVNQTQILETVKINTFPNVQAENKIPSEIAEIYPKFHDIYSQAIEAESAGLNLITGIAYRKSLEYLVKLFLIEKFPTEEDAIKKETLGQSIKRIEYPLIQNLAKAATWIGNDEAHFVRKHEDYSIEDMQRFILSLCHLIVAEVVADQASSLVDKN